ncbi:DUF4136 domain-containing protein [Chitiniphilus purpureus]|uniref:DUF4136 domain-containing protein n=1 Tax=Chitiniphilus purpureus TaxID=2981137 RepID=A0ABY6DKW4_9NEIS|nr:DUF4136 domain-containing protein [Chitiniphilus sp. CD1]UXY15005.1 DUF4136 domain-containing protein [Chitiniphilus sp. CD1]
MRRLALLSVLLATGCAAPQFVAQVSVRHMIDAPFQGKRFAFQRNEAQQQSLLQREVEQQVGAALAQQGLALVGAHEADWLVSLDYGSDKGRTVTRQQPLWGTVGYGVWYQRLDTAKGAVWVPRYYPESGIVGSVPISHTVYTHFLSMDIYDRRTLATGEFAKRYEGRATHAADEAALDPALPWLIRALFQSFPGFSGATREVRLLLPQK